MAITQDYLIGWSQIESSPDIKIIAAALASLGDEELMLELEAERAGRRDCYPVRVVWNSILACIILGHPTFAALIRELRRNGELRQALGMDPMAGADAVPTASSFSRMLAKLAARREKVEAIFTRLVSRAMELLPDFGKRLALDGKAIHSLRASDPQADQGAKASADEPGKVLYTWHGFKLHMLSDIATELPVAFAVTAASAGECPQALPLVEKALEQQPALAARARSLAADKGLDSGPLKAALYDKLGITPLIPARDLAKGEYRPLDGKVHDTVYVSPTGEVCCRVDPFNKDVHKQFCPMQFCGFEKDRQALKFRCPAAGLGVTCANKEACKGPCASAHGRVVRVPLDKDRRLFGPAYSASQSFKDLYKGRTSVERLFCRLDHMFGMEQPLRTDGLDKAFVRVSLALSAMLATALSWLSAGRPEMARCRLQSAA